MKYGYVKVGAYTPEIKVCDVDYNVKSIIDGISLAESKGVEVLVFPELCLTGATCGDLFFSDVLIKGAYNGLKVISEYLRDKKMLVFVGLPFKKDGLIYDVVAGIYNGEILGLVAKNKVDTRWFAPCPDNAYYIDLFNDEDKMVHLGQDLVFTDEQNDNLRISVDIGEDAYLPITPSTKNLKHGVSLIVNPTAFNTTVNENENRLQALKSFSLRNKCGVISANAGKGESTTDCVYGGFNVIAEDGEILSTSAVFETGLIVSEIDVDAISFKRSIDFKSVIKSEDFVCVPFSTQEKDFTLTRKYFKSPFIPQTATEMERQAERILNIQAEGLRKRIEHTNSKCVVLGLSGGLDSTLAILVANLAIKKCGKNPKDVIAVTMPCFGTTSRTYQNTLKLAKSLGATLKKVDITKSVERHLKDIKHEDGVFDATFENSQARERTQVLMDISNSMGGFVVGTGDLSELALGWATYNGDHMSMYGVNGTLPKTLIRYIVNYVAVKSKGKLKAVLFDILDTPVSPELLPPKDGDIAQKTEDIVGPYILHDFFLYHIIKDGFTPKKTYFVATETFKGEFDNGTVLKWLKTFIRRFFTQQFKRSCLPDGVKATEISLSPRGGLSMPSDAVSSLWLKELEDL